MLIVVSGWRLHPDPYEVYAVLDGYWRAHPANGGPFIVAHGACPTGADQYADQWAVSRPVPVKRYDARDFGVWPWCGPRRNTAMVHEAVSVRDAGEHEVEVVAFPQLDWQTARRCGTRDLIVKARVAGFEPRIHPVSDGVTQATMPGRDARKDGI